MGKVYELLDDKMRVWMEKQPVFFVATAPLAPDGHVNCSPKGGNSLKVINPTTIAYQDLTGSGAETIAHLRENNRIVLMFCSFEGPPRILRLHGEGDVATLVDPTFESLSRHFPGNPGMRAIIRIRLNRIANSCGYGVPLMDYQRDRDALDKWTQAKGPSGLEDYRQANNQRSVDGLPAFEDR